LLAMPQAHSLFRQAILESGSNTFKTLEEAVPLSEQFLGILGLGPADGAQLRAVPVEKLLAAYQKLGMKLNIKGSVLEPVVDGNILPCFPIEAVKKGSASSIAVMAGTNLEESRFMAMADRGLALMDEAALTGRWQKVLPPDLVPPLIATCRKALEKSGVAVNAADIALALQTHIQFRIPAVRLLEAHSHNNNPAYSYLFTWRSPQAELGACHALEVGFVFGVLVPGFNGIGARADKLAQQMQDAWIAFARNGNPGCESLGVWPQYGPQRQTMILGEDCHVETAPLDAERRAWEPVPDKFLG
jgi:para-nitrobenzyl esterase